MPESTVFESAGSPSTLSTIGDTIQMPWSAVEADDRVVRPALAVLFRIAIGPAADDYVPRFLRYERTGRSLPGWHWPAFFAAPVWAFYRRLWVPGLVAALLPLVGLATFAAIAPAIDDDAVAWLTLAALLVGVLPGAIAAVLANSLLYHHVRRIVADAEAARGAPHDVAAIVARTRPTSLPAALGLGAGALAVVLSLAGPTLEALHGEFAARVGVAESLAAMRPLQRQVEESVRQTSTIPPQPDAAALQAYLAATLIDAVNLSQGTGRLRLVLGPALPALAGKMILLVPAQDVRQRVEWLCIPIDIDARYLPADCRKR